MERGEKAGEDIWALGDEVRSTRGSPLSWTDGLKEAGSAAPPGASEALKVGVASARHSGVRGAHGGPDRALGTHGKQDIKPQPWH